jgi:thiol:disulfide interchange protein DsbA
MTIGVALLISVLWGTSAQAQWVAGQHYTVLDSPQLPALHPGEVEVVEVFSYTCSHCYALEPYLAQWLQKKPSYVHFTRLSAVWDDRRRSLTRLHYALDVLRRPDVQSAAFEALHKDRNALYDKDEAETYRLQLAFAKEHGINAPEFEKAYRSAAVEANVKRAEELLLTYRIEKTPTLVINGKYTITPEQARTGQPGAQRGDFTRLLAVASDLAAQEHQATQAIAAARAR